MIHDGDYYSILYKDKILSLMDEIEQNIIWFTTETSYDIILCSQDLWARILILQRLCRHYQVGRIAHERLYKRRQKHSTEFHELCCMKLNINTVSRLDYMIHDGEYYSIFNEDKILSLMDEIEKKIIWMWHQKFIWKILCSQVLWARSLIL